MTTIKANCRDNLTAADIQYVAKAIAPSTDEPASLVQLLTDPESRDAALESRALYRLVIDDPQLLAISPHLYFYVLTRNTLCDFDRPVSDYVANILSTFLQLKHLRTLPEHPELQTEYITDMLATLNAAPAEREFLIRVHVGNYSLFVTGLFPAYLEQRANRRGAPALSFYEGVGRQSYCLASTHRLARRQELGDVYRTIGEHFSEIRNGLNQLADRLICLEPSWNSLS